ncbi:hypothetical protein KUCAC02_023940 [Chaenocephalus aceratus]|uniref:Uncharacterized protein n=1 Tax=Chaenocephalus aceratus TaxID=36190 RepID=A0ACB9WHV4_CHAAC|nr:hypothetical protein KUCAC02_023940 [Chaenocephalus aceratus]
MEDMEDDSLDTKDDHNHNCCASSSSKVRTYLRSQLSGVATVPQPACPLVPGGEPGTRRGKLWSGSTGGSKFMDSDSGSESSEVSETDCTAPPAAVEGKFTLESTSKFLLNAMAVEDYRKNHWPNLEKAIDRLLIRIPQTTSLFPMHRYTVTSTTSLQCIVPVFMYLNKFYIESKLNRDLREDLMKLFADCVAEIHLSTLMPLLIKAHSMPFQVQPSTMASVVKGLYSLRPDWAKLAPALFSGFIPQINPPAVESLLPDYAAHDQKLQMDLSMMDFHGDQSRKRASEDS